MKYYKAYWDECSFGTTKGWGKSWFYFEVNEDMYPIRQIQLFDNKRLLRYSEDYTNDKYGSLSDQPLRIDEGPFEDISQIEFEEIWRTSGTLWTNWGS